VTLTERVTCTIDTWDGPKQIAAYGVMLDYSAFTMDGAIEVFAKASSSRAGIADRIIGPLRLYRKTGYDHTLTIGTGGDYATLQHVIATYATGTSHIRIDVISDLVIDPTVTPFTNGIAATNTRRGTVDVFANGYKVLGKSAGTFSLWRPGVNGLRLLGLKFDIANLIQIQPEVPSNAFTDQHRPLALNECEIYSSNGMLETPGPSGATGKSLRSLPALNYNCMLIASHAHDCYPGDSTPLWRIGSKGERRGGDYIHIPPSATMPPAVAAYNILLDTNVAPLRVPSMAFHLYYTGVGTPTYIVTGTHERATRTLTLKINGTPVPGGSFIASVAAARAIMT
jgi:hypothetical protein